MKKLLLLSLLLNFTLINTTSAQLNLSLAAGVNYTDYQYKNMNHFITNSETGYFIEAAPAFRLNEKFRLLVNGQYSLKGYGFYEHKFDATLTQVRFTFFDIIPELEYKIYDFVDLGIGIQYGLKIREERKFEEGRQDNPPSDVEQAKSSDFGITAKLKLTYKNAFGFVRYNIGLKDVSALNYLNASGQSVKQNSRILQVGVGYNFSLKKNKA